MLRRNCLNLLLTLGSALLLNLAWAQGVPDPVPVLKNRLPATAGPKTLLAVSWNLKRLGRKQQDMKGVAALLEDADIVTFQEVNTTDSGLHALQAIARVVHERRNEKICMGLSNEPTGSKERYAYLWRDSRVAYVRADGEVMVTCPETAVTIRLGVRNADRIAREPAFGTFYFRPLARPFVFASIHLRPSGKKPQLEVPPLFETFAHVELPAIIAGDYNLDSTHSSFVHARELGFQAAMRGVKTSLKMKTRELNKPYDNFWFKGVRLERVNVINLFEAFPTMGARDIYNQLSDHSPVVAEFRFVD